MTDAESATHNSVKETSSELHTPRRTTTASASAEADSSFDTMLSVSFSTPLAGQARAEKIKQMTKNHASTHPSPSPNLNPSPVQIQFRGSRCDLTYPPLQPAFEKSRLMQQILVKVQHSLRRMPGVSAAESSEIVQQLQEVGQVISQETSALVDALMNLTLDQEDTDKAVARMSIEANISKAKIDDQSNTIQKLNEQVEEEKEKRTQAEEGVKSTMEELHSITEEFKAWKDKAGVSQESTSERDVMIQTLEATVKHLEDQVNSRRSLWIMKHSDQESVARALETLTDSVQDNPSVHRTLMALRPRVARENDSGARSSSERSFSEFGGALQPSDYQAFPRPPTAMGNFQVAPARPTSTAPFSRRNQGPWNQPNPRAQAPGSSLFSMPSSSSFTRNSNRKPYSTTPSHFSPSAAEFYPWNPVPSNEASTMRNNFNQGKEAYPRTPTAPGRGRYGRTQEPPSGGSAFDGNGGGGGGGQTSTAMVTRNAFVGPLIHLNERSVAAWHSDIMEFYAVIRAFVERHASQPDHASSMKMSSTALWPILLATYHPLSDAEAASYLEYHLRNENSKACLVTRVIIDYIVNRVWTPAAWTGADDESTYALINLERDMERLHGQPSAFRQPLLDRQAAIIDAILHREPSTNTTAGSGPSQFHRQKTEQVATTLITSLKPLLNKLANPVDACRDMEQVAEYAWELSSKILTSRLTFDFRFPEIGSRFSSQSMLPIWPRMDPFELQAKHWRVALVTTPVITCRNDTGTNISAHSVSLADVFCMH
ncbi:hypothetical protein K4F52_004385 [Lecanicillium sp. MT-2017a]|nr:hypothetical protein K4F52_004385 [Lecanicillium sp. MT-2017a]